MPAVDGRADDFSPGLEWTDERLQRLFAPFLAHRAIVLAVSGGPDSTALTLLARRWRRNLSAGPIFHVASVDHGLRPEAADEAAAVGLVANRLGLPHALLRLDAQLAPTHGVQEAAREARYDVLARHARAVGATAIATGHTLDDQAETVLFRLIRGSGLSGLAGMPGERPVHGIALLRPLLSLRKDELVAACRRAGVAFIDDPSNRDPRFARARLRALLPLLEREGLGAGRLARLAERAARADAALEAGVDAAAERMVEASSASGWRLGRAGFFDLPEEIALRLLGRAIRATGTEGVLELGKLEVLQDWIRGGHTGARTLAGALVRVTPDAILVTPAPARRRPGSAADAKLHAPQDMLSARHLGKDQGRT